MKSSQHIVIFLDGQEPISSIANHCISQADIVIATDGAARYMRRMNLIPNLIIGDLDSIDEETYRFYQNKGVSIIHESTQYSTDFEKALEYCIAECIGSSISVLGIHGKQTDHLLTNFSVLLRYSKKIASVIAYDDTHEHYFLHDGKPSTVIEKPLKTKISLTPLPAAYGVTTEGLLYPINREDMTFGNREGLSNRLSAVTATISISSGALLVSVPLNVSL